MLVGWRRMVTAGARRNVAVRSAALCCRWGALEWEGIKKRRRKFNGGDGSLMTHFPNFVLT